MELDMKQLAVAIRTIAEEKNLPEDVVQDAVEQALAAAYRKDFGDREQEVRVTMNLNTGQVDAFITKTVVSKVADDLIEIILADAKKINPEIKLGETVEVHETISQFGRVAAQTAKQVILQKLRESERDIIMNEYEDKIGTVINGIVARVEPRIVRVDLGKAQGIMPMSEQIQTERYYPGQRLKVFLKDVEKGFRGPQLVVSRGNKDFVEWLFKNEVPEMENGSVEIKDIAREGGVRTKIAVFSNTPGIDPVGTFVGGHGTRVNAVMSEVGEQEKIDIIVWSAEPKEYITNALSPTKVTNVVIDERSKKAAVFVPEDQLSIAIGKSGQNVRLASKLTGYELDINSDSQIINVADDQKAVAQSSTGEPVVVESKIVTPKLKKKEQLESSLLDAINDQSDN
jgi:N utilization substance protein A